MSFNGSGVYTLYATGNPVVTGTTISSSWANNTLDDIATALNLCILKDGQQTVTANIPMSTYKFTGVGAGTALTDAATIANIINGTGTYVGTVGGTADAITLTPSTAIAAYAAGQRWAFIASGANTTNVTVAISSLAARALTKNGSTALVAGDIPSGAMVFMVDDGTRLQMVGCVANLANLKTANSWTTLQTFTNSMFKLLGSSTGGTTLTSDNAGATDYTMHLPAENGTLATIAAAQRLTNKSLDSTTTRISDTTDTTKNVILDVSAISSATTATFAFPSGAGTFMMASAVVPADISLFSTASIAASAASVTITLPTTSNEVTVEILDTFANSGVGMFFQMNASTAAVYDQAVHWVRANSANAADTGVVGKFNYTAFLPDGEQNFMIGDSKDNPTSITIDMAGILGNAFKQVVVRADGGRGNGGNQVILADLSGVWKSSAVLTALTFVPNGCLLMGGKIKVWGKKG